MAMTDQDANSGGPNDPLAALPDGPPAAPAPQAAAPAAPAHTRISGIRTGMIAAAVALLLLVIVYWLATASSAGRAPRARAGAVLSLVPPAASHPRPEEATMLVKLIKAAVLAAVLAAIVQSLPDIKRYLELREM